VPPQGSVRKQLDNKKTPLSWVQRAHIAVGAAQGLAYLHDLADPPVVHRDFKTSNILVMADFEVRVCLRRLVCHRATRPCAVRDAHTWQTNGLDSASVSSVEPEADRGLRSMCKAE
jgi:hypothetical protein